MLLWSSVLFYWRHHRDSDRKTQDHFVAFFSSKNLPATHQQPSNPAQQRTMQDLIFSPASALRFATGAFLRYFGLICNIASRTCL